MPITEIDPNDPVFQTVRQESQPGKLNLSGKFAMPAFMQKRETAMYRPPVPQPQPVPREVPRPAPMPRPAPQPTPQPLPKPQPLPTMPARKPLSQPVVIRPKKPILPPLPEQYPTEPQEIDFDTSSDIDELVEDAAQPVSQPSWALPQHRPLHRTTPAPISATELSSQEIYGTGKGFKFPSFKFPSRKPAAIPEQDEYMSEQETGFYTTSVAKRLAFISVGVLLIYFGLTSSGSYYQPATHFSGDLATVFYVYQLGTLMAMAGVVLVYDAVRRVGKL